MCTKNAHTSIQVQRNIRPSLRNGLTAYAALSLETNSSCLRRRRIDGSANPVGLTKTSADLTPATGARTTRFCRTQLPSPNHSTGHVRPAEVLAEAFKRRSSTRCRSLTENRPANMPARPTLPRPPHPIPTFRDDRDTPLVQGDEVRNITWRRLMDGSGIFSPAAYDGSTAPCASIVVVTAKTDRYRFCYIPLRQPRLFGAIEKCDDYGSSAVLKPPRDHLGYLVDETRRTY